MPAARPALKTDTLLRKIAEASLLYCDMQRRSAFLNENTLFWITPLVVCCAIHWAGFQSYFWGDDFNWLNQKHLLDQGESLFKMLFTPTPHGTWRPWTDHLYFIVLSKIFGFEPLPFRIVAFITQFGSLALLASIVRRLSGSALAGMLAPILWTLNGNTSTSMAWSYAYMQVLCGFTILLAFRLLLAYDETGRPLYYWLQVLVFVLGLGVMETTSFYPALAVIWAWFTARNRLPVLLPLLGVSAVFVILHALMIPKNTTGYYSMHFDSSIVKTFAEYCHIAVLPTIVESPHRLAVWMAHMSVWSSLTGLCVYLAYTVWRKQFLPIVFLGWYLVLLAPVLPLRDHISNYYLTLPAIGLGALGACAIQKGLSAGRWAAALTLILAAPYVLASAYLTPRYTRYLRDISWTAEDLIDAAVQARAAHPGKTIVFDNVPALLLLGCIYEDCFTVMGIQNALASEPTQAIPGTDAYSYGKVGYNVSAPEVRAGLASGLLVLYENIKGEWQPASRATSAKYSGGGRNNLPVRIDLDRDLPPSWLVGDWGSRGPGIRWAGRNVGVKLSGPASASAKLEISGYCFPSIPAAPSLHKLAVAVDGKSVGQAILEGCGDVWRFTFDLPAGTANKPEILVEVNIDPVVFSAVEDRLIGLPIARIRFVE